MHEALSSLHITCWHFCSYVSHYHNAVYLYWDVHVSASSSFFFRYWNTNFVWELTFRCCPFFSLRRCAVQPVLQYEWIPSYPWLCFGKWPSQWVVCQVSVFLGSRAVACAWESASCLCVTSPVVWVWQQGEEKACFWWCAGGRACACVYVRACVRACMYCFVCHPSAAGHRCVGVLKSDEALRSCDLSRTQRCSHILEAAQAEVECRGQPSRSRCGHFTHHGCDVMDCSVI